SHQRGLLVRTATIGTVQVACGEQRRLHFEWMERPEAMSGEAGGHPEVFDGQHCNSPATGGPEGSSTIAQGDPCTATASVRRNHSTQLRQLATGSKRRAE